jgi:hypothetical protein
MVVVDTSSPATLATTDLLTTVLDEYDVHTTDAVVGELEDTAEYDDEHGAAARTVLDNRNRLTVHGTSDREFRSSRIDGGEGSCALRGHRCDADFLVTDDLRALPELQPITTFQVAITPILLKTLVERERLDEEDALEKLDGMAESRDWLGAPIHRRARRLFE